MSGKPGVLLGQALVTTTSRPLSWNVPSAASPFASPVGPSLCLTPPTFPSAPGAGPLPWGGKCVQWDCSWPASCPLFIVSPSGPTSQPCTQCKVTYQPGSQGGWAEPTLHCHLLQENKALSPPASTPAGWEQGQLCSMSSISFQTHWFRWRHLR